MERIKRLSSLISEKRLSPWREMTVAVDIRRPHFGYGECAFSVMLEWPEIETGISGKGAGVG